MIVVELPGAGHVIRAAILGTCRVLRPMGALVSSGEAAAVASGLHKCHTVGEARQALDIVTGEAAAPELAIPLMFAKRRKLPSPGLLRRAWPEGIDVFLMEVSTARQFHFEGHPLQEALVASELIEPRGASLLGWFRQVCLAGAADSACVEDAVEMLNAAGMAPDKETLALLRGLRLAKLNADGHAAILDAMMVRHGGAWVVVGPFAVAEDEGALMSDRRALMGDLAEAAGRCGAAVYDPSTLIDRFGRAPVLAGQGRHLYHYASEFIPKAGAALARVIGEAWAFGGEPASRRSAATARKPTRPARAGPMGW